MANHVLRDRIWESNKLARCSRDAALAYPWIFLVADDHGRFEYRPRVIWGRVFAAREDVTVEDVTNWLTEYEQVGLLVRYKSGELAHWTGFAGRPPSQRRESLYPDPSTVKEPKRRQVRPINKDRQSLGGPYEEPSHDLLTSEIDRIGSEQSRSGAESPATAPAFPSQRAADVFLRHYPKGEPPGAMFKALRPLVLKHGWPAVEPELEAYLSRTEIDFHSWPKFAAGFGTWAAGSASLAIAGRASPTPKEQRQRDSMTAAVVGGLKGDGTLGEES